MKRISLTHVLFVIQNLQQNIHTMIRFMRKRSHLDAQIVTTTFYKRLIESVHEKKKQHSCSACDAKFQREHKGIKA